MNGKAREFFENWIDGRDFSNFTSVEDVISNMLFDAGIAQEEFGPNLQLIMTKAITNA